MLQTKLNLHERRGKHRLPLQRRVSIDCASAGQLELAGVDYSPAGISVFSSRPLPVGEQLRLRFRVGRHLQTELEVAGEIVHHCPQADGYIIGIRFLESLDMAPGSRA